MTNDFLKKSKIKGTSSPWQKPFRVAWTAQVDEAVSLGQSTTDPLIGRTSAGVSE